MKYPQVYEGEWVTPIRKNYRMACCSCGLVHRMEFRLVKHRNGKAIQMRAYRDNRATAQIRRHRNE